MIGRNSIGHAFPLAPLGELVEFLDSKRRPVTESERRPGPYPYFGANGQQGTIDDYLFDEPLVLLAEDGGHFDDPDRGIAYKISGKTWVNNHAHVIRTKDNIHLGYLCRVLENYDVRPFISGTTRGKLTKAAASQIPVPVPPLAEQRRIAAILDKADELRAKRRATLSKLDTFTQSIFLDLFTRKDSANWPLTSVADVASPVEGSIRTGPFGSQLLHSEFVDEGVAVLGIDNAVENEFRWAKPRFITERKYQELRRYTVHPGDVLITIMGTCGRCAIVPDDVPRAINTKHLCCITLDHEKCLPAFLHKYFLIHPIARRYLDQTAKGAIMAGLNMAIIKDLPVRLAPLDLQMEFVKLLENVRSLRATHEASSVQSDSLFLSLQARAFAGEI